LHTQGTPDHAGVAREVHLDAVGGHRLPRRGVLERIHEAHGSRRGRGNQERHGGKTRGQRPTASHPFTLPIITPRMYWRCRARNTASTGSTVSTEPAIINSVSCTCSPTRLASATGSVYFESSVRMISGHMKSFHAERKVNTASVARIGRRSGSTMVAKMRSSEAPSTRAASSRS